MRNVFENTLWADIRRRMVNHYRDRFGFGWNRVRRRLYLRSSFQRLVPARNTLCAAPNSKRKRCNEEMTSYKMLACFHNLHFKTLFLFGIARRRRARFFFWYSVKNSTDLVHWDLYLAPTGGWGGGRSNIKILRIKFQ